jgi:hypothetical protein
MWFFCCVVFDRKLVSQIFYANEIEDELRSRNMLDFPFHCTIKYKNAMLKLRKYDKKTLFIHMLAMKWERAEASQICTLWMEFGK